jgi:hypothetical protein
MKLVRGTVLFAAAGAAVFSVIGVAAADTGSDTTGDVVRGVVIPYLVLLAVTGTLAAYGIMRMVSKRSAR